MATTKLDLTGLKCPLPALKTRKALKSLAPGDILRSALHRSAVGDRHSESDPRDRRQGRDHRERDEKRIVFLIEKLAAPTCATVPHRQD